MSIFTRILLFWQCFQLDRILIEFPILPQFFISEFWRGKNCRFFRSRPFRRSRPFCRFCKSCRFCRCYLVNFCIFCNFVYLVYLVDFADSVIFFTNWQKSWFWVFFGIIQVWLKKIYQIQNFSRNFFLCYRALNTLTNL